MCVSFERQEGVSHTEICETNTSRENNCRDLEARNSLMNSRNMEKSRNGKEMAMQHGKVTVDIFSFSIFYAFLI
jgi:hypothetical protein